MHLFIDPTDVSLYTAQLCKQQLLIISGITPYCQTFSVLDYVSLIQFLYDISISHYMYITFACAIRQTKYSARTDSTLVIYVKSFVIYC